MLPKAPDKTNGKKVALIGGGPASLTVARDLIVMGYECTLFEKDPQAGGLMRTNIQYLRQQKKVLEEETDIILKQIENTPENKKEQILQGKLNKFIKENTN